MATRTPRSTFLPPTTPPGPRDPGPVPGSGSPIPPPTSPRGPTTPGPRNPGPLPPPDSPMPPPPPSSDPRGAIFGPAGIGQGYLGYGLELPFYTAPSYAFGPPPASVPTPVPDPYPGQPPGFQAPAAAPRLDAEGPNVETPSPTPGLDLNNTPRTEPAAPFLTEPAPADGTKRLSSLGDVLRSYRRLKGGTRMTFGG